MTKVMHREAFMQQLANKSIDTHKLVNDAQVRSAVTEAGGSVADLASADLDGNGKISTESELRSLFKQLDKWDVNGSSKSFIIEKADGTPTPAGKVVSWLDVQAQQIGGTDPTAPTPGDNALAALGKRFAQAGAQSIASKMQGHLDAIENTGVGLYYGDHSYYKDMSSAEKREWVKENALPGCNPDMPKESSCIGWALDNVGAAYKGAGKAERWQEIYSSVTSRGAKGMDLAKELKKDGWEAVYWNPDAKHPDDSNAEHSFSALQVSRGKPYYGVQVDHQVLNYRPTEGEGTRQDMSGIDKLKEVPFFFGLAKGGVHTFVGREGKVNEFHWSEMPNSQHAIEENPLQDFMWNSGVIMVPPGSWPR